MALPVLEILEHYNRYTRVQPYSAFSPSREAGDAMSRGRSSWAKALNVDLEEITLGPSTSMNSYVMAQALGPSWEPGDEIILSQQDHEANHGVWRRMAEQRGIRVIDWQVDAATGLLDPQALYALLSERTRWVFFPHCSNIIGTVNPVADIAREIRSRSQARIGVDGVAYAPHHVPDLGALDVDLYMFSLYKVFGPHQGVLYVRSDLQPLIAPQCHRFLVSDPSKRFNPAGPQHAEVAAAAGVIDYFQELVSHHGIRSGSDLFAGLQALREPISRHERALAEPILDLLEAHPRVRLLGKTHCRDDDRAPTIAFRHHDLSSAQIAGQLQSMGIGTENGHFYARGLLEALDIEPADGVVRISLVHYNSLDEVRHIVESLDNVLL